MRVITRAIDVPESKLAFPFKLRQFYTLREPREKQMRRQNYPRPARKTILCTIFFFSLFLCIIEISYLVCHHVVAVA